MATTKCPNCNNTGILGGGYSGIYCACIHGTLLEMENEKREREEKLYQTKDNPHFPNKHPSNRL
jgi:hypothetical protein